MAVYVCESFQIVGAGPINYSVTKKIIAKAGGTPQMALQEALDEAAQSGDDAGQAFMKNDSCAAPCTCLKFVVPMFWGVDSSWAAGKVGKVLNVTVTGQWLAHVLCQDPAKHPKDEPGNKKDGKSDDKPEKTPGGKSGDKPGKKPGKKKSGRKAGSKRA